MKGKRKSNLKKCVLFVTGSIATAVVACVIIPPLMKKISNKLYKSDIENEEIDIENMGPEIVKKEKQEK